MKYYLLEDETSAKNCRQLLKLAAECAKLNWSKTMGDMPEKVQAASLVIQDYVEEKLMEYCNSKTYAGEISESEESELFVLFKKYPLLKDTLGSGVVIAGKEAGKVAEELRVLKAPDKIIQAISSGKQFVMV